MYAILVGIHTPPPMEDKFVIFHAGNVDSYEKVKGFGESYIQITPYVKDFHERGCGF